MRFLLAAFVLCLTPVMMASSCQGSPVVEYDADKGDAEAAEAGECIVNTDCIPDKTLFCNAECKDGRCVYELCIPRPIFPKLDAGE